MDGRIRQRNRAILLEILLSNPCVMCKTDDILVLEFDHLRDKKRHVTTMALSRWGVSSIMAEVFKCRILCSNCHTIETRRGSNDYRWIFSEGHEVDVVR